MRAVPLNRYLLFLTIAAVGCAIDLWTKHWIFARLGMPGESPPISIWDGVFSLTTSLNEGALFGVGQGQTFLFGLLSIAAAVGILYWLFLAGGAVDLLLTVALGCVMAGILGNLYDRLGLPALKWHAGNMQGHAPGEPVYAVRDWLHFRIESVIDWPVFNIADSLLVCGAVLMVWHAFKAENRAAEKASAPEREASGSSRAR